VPVKKRLINGASSNEKKKNSVDNSPNTNGKGVRNGRLKVKYSEDEYDFEDEDDDENNCNDEDNVSMSSSRLNNKKSGANDSPSNSSRAKNKINVVKTVSKPLKCANNADLNSSNNKIKLVIDDDSDDDFGIKKPSSQNKIEDCDETNESDSSKEMASQPNGLINEKNNDESLRSDELKENITGHIQEMEADDEGQNDDFSEGNNTTSTFITACEDVFVTDVTSGVVTVTIKESASPDGFFKKRSVD
jgi:hypothetical protein